MKPTESQIEELLRRAPRPSAPAGLKDKLTGQIALSTASTASSNGVSPLRPLSWLQRWWPALAPATASLAFAAVLVVQQNEIAALKASVRDLNATLSTATNNAPVKFQPVSMESVVPAANTEADEIARLQKRVAALTTEIGQLESMQKANESLRTQLATSSGLSQPEVDALAEAKARAQSILCVNNLKQIGLAVRIWGVDHDNVNPPSFLSLSNELGNPKILFCPGYTNQTPVKTWAEFAATSSTYEFAAAGATNADIEPQRIMARCLLHNNIGLCDGSVQMVSKQDSEFIVERDGKLYFEMNAKSTTSKP